MSSGKAKLGVRHEGDQVIAHVGVEIAPNADGSIYRILDRETPRRDGLVFYLDAKADGPLESR